MREQGFDTGESTAGPKRQTEITYDYTDEHGKLLFQVVRYAPKGFSQRAPDDAGGWRRSLGGVRRVLYRLPELRSASLDDVVYVVEGEKDSDRLASLGFLATTCPGGANKWCSEYATPLTGRDVVIVPDNDSPGLEHAEQVRVSLASAARRVAVLRLDGLAEKEDVSNWLDAGGTAEQLADLASQALSKCRPKDNAALLSDRMFTAAELQSIEFPAIRWIVPGILPEGLTIFAGKPKLGKSWLALDAAIAVAGGASVLRRQCEAGAVLYLALEDNPRRLQRRLKKIKPNLDWPTELQFQTQFPRIDDGGLGRLRGWLESQENVRLIIIDTLAVVRPQRGKSESLHSYDYTSVRGLHQLATEFGVAVLVVHHLRKADSDDPLDAVSGSTGLTGAADTTLTLTRRETDGGAILYGRGRDLDEFETALEFDPVTCRWSDLGDPMQAFAGDTRAAILSAIQAGHSTPRDIAQHADTGDANIRQTLRRMVRAGDLRKDGRGVYRIAADPLSHKSQCHNGVLDCDNVTGVTPPTGTFTEYF